MAARAPVPVPVVDEMTPEGLVASGQVDPVQAAAAAKVIAATSIIGSHVERAIAAGDLDALATIARLAETLVSAGVVSTTEAQMTAAVALGRAVRGEAPDTA